VPGLYDTPKLRSFFSVYTDCLIEKVTAEIGYEAVLSDIGFSIKSFENMGFKIKFSGYNDKIVKFIQIFFQIMFKIH
jgi:secreted Zn-dependent insulinase-like peptidase